ncbi:MAG: penicillin-binding protein 2 [Kiritimatiellae bacterium]|nr:penicillin-binding protein 2 [Kiritimatiellia bacterium]
MKSIDSPEMELWRIRLVLVGWLTAFAVLIVVIWRIQIVEAAKYESRGEQQSIRRVRLPAVRGTIFDRNGVPLAENRPSYCLVVYVEELRRPGRWENTINEVERILDRIALLIGTRRTLTRDDIRVHILRRLPLPLVAWRDLEEEAVARWAVCGEAFPGVDLTVEPVRVYPGKLLAAHAVGYVGKAEPVMGEEEVDFYLPEIEGKSGVEKALNVKLSGKPGASLIRVDASGFKHSEVERREPRAGDDVYLTLDSQLQAIVEGTLEGTNGAAVVLDPRNGDILAMVSAPAFDPNEFSMGITLDRWRALLNHPGQPMLNRAVAGMYPPGSTFKPLIAIAALENRKATSTTTFTCLGTFDVGGLTFGCWQATGHGPLALRTAIEQSCNCYFFQLALQVGQERIYYMADALGFGRKTGIELLEEKDGLLPNEKWKMNRLRERWSAGDTCNLAIGQGLLLVTPLQMAVFCATIANGGHVYRPRIVLGPEMDGELVNEMCWSTETLAVIRGGMFDSVNAETGTGKRARSDRILVAGKTGSAEYGDKTKPRKYAWMIAFAPFENPRYAVALVVEDATAGGVDAAPRIRHIMDRLGDLARIEGPGGRRLSR